jgi:hypothetical protein
VNDRDFRYARIRHMATGALAALALVGAIAGATALAAKPGDRTHGHAAVVNCSATKAPPSAAAEKTGAAKPPANPQAFLNDIQQLVANGTITATEARTVDREIIAGKVDTDTLTASGFTGAQLDAVSQALGNTKRALAAAAPHATK